MPNVGEPLHDRSGAALAQVLVHRRGAAVVGVALDANLGELGMILEDRPTAVEERIAVRAGCRRCWS